MGIRAFLIITAVSNTGAISAFQGLLLALDRRGEQLGRADDVVGADAACEQAVINIKQPLSAHLK